MATPRCTQLIFSFQPKPCLDFRGGHMTTDPGLLLLRELDEKFFLTKALDRAQGAPLSLPTSDHDRRNR